MSKQFLKNGEVQLINGGYLSNKEGKPVSNAEFVKAQQHAEYIVKFASEAKGKDFVGKPAENLEAFKTKIREMVNSNQTVEFVKMPKEVKRPMNEKLQSEALAFIDFQTSSSKTEKINQFLQQFSILKEFEDFGLFFEEEIVKLNEIYTMDEVIKAVTETVDLLG